MLNKQINNTLQNIKRNRAGICVHVKSITSLFFSYSIPVQLRSPRNDLFFYCFPLSLKYSGVSSRRN